MSRDRTPVLKRALATVALVAAAAGLAACGPSARTTAATTGLNASTGASASAVPSRSSSAAASPSPSTDPNPVPAMADKVILGAYLDLSGKSQAQSLALRKSQFGRDERIVHTFYEWTDTLPTSFPGKPSGAIPMISWRGTYYAAINDGSQDALIGNAALALKKYGKPVFLRWAWEMNGSWYPWGGTNNNTRTEGFVKAWRRLHDIFVAKGATNVAWVWGPNWYSKPTDPWNALTNYYPGDAYVDWVGISGYSTGRLTPGDLFDAFYKDYADREPVMIAETGIAESGGTIKADWIASLATWITQRPAVHALVWFDTDTFNGPNWRIDTSATATAAYKAMANSPRFEG